MPDDDHHFSGPRPDPEQIDLAAIKTDLEFAIDQISRLHTQLARTALGIIFSTAVVTTALGWWFIARWEVRRAMTSPGIGGRLYLLALAAIALIGVVLVFIVGLIHLWPYALAGAAVLLVGLVIPIILGMANT
jgi:hypothetical protein